MSGTNAGSDAVRVDAAAALTNDAERTAAASRLLGAGEGSVALQNIAALAAQLLGTPSAEVSLLTDVRVIVAAVGALPGPAGTRTRLEDALCTRVAATGERFVVHDLTADARLADVAADLGRQVGAYLAIPLVSDDRQVVGAICAYQPQARQWTEQDVTTLEHLASAAAAQLEIAALHEQYTDAARENLLLAAVHAGGIGTFQWDLPSGALRWDSSLLEVFGYDEESFGGTIEAFDARVHPDDLPHVTSALRSAIEACGIYEAEFRVRRPDGVVVWLVARGRAVPGPSGVAEQVIGVTTDTTALRSGEQRVREILEGMTVGYFRLGADWRFTYVNSEAERILGRSRQELTGGVLWDLFPAAVGADFETGCRRVAETGETVVFDAYYPEPLDAWYEVRAVPEDGGVAAYFTDVTARRRALAASEGAQQRLRLLAGVAGKLAEAVDPVQALSAVLPLLVPRLADFAIASVLQEGHGDWRQRLHDVAALHADPSRQRDLDDYLAVRVPALTQESPVGRALATGRPASVVDAGASHAGHLLRPGPAHDLLARLGPHATVVLPLRGRGRTRGLITLVNGAERGAFTADDLTTVQEAVAQIGLALDNLHLNATRRDLVEELQRSLLTELPEPDHLHLVARYAPAASGAQIGGDWYDAFLQRDGSTCLVIGDVTGHDLSAAVAMAQIRNVLRGGAHAVVQPPAAVLGGLDWAMHDLHLDVMSTAILAKVERTDELAAQGRRLLRWSNAGHLPPLLIHPDGRAELLRRPSDMLLGVGPHQERHDHERVLEPGATVLLYTDGLVERRGEALLHGLDRLRHAAQRLAGLPLEELCDRLIADLAQGSEDDVALLALRAHPEDEPRPAEAGPTHLPG